MGDESGRSMYSLLRGGEDQRTDYLKLRVDESLAADCGNAQALEPQVNAGRVAAKPIE
jgi:hypothetical protein